MSHAREFEQRSSLPLTSSDIFAKWYVPVWSQGLAAVLICASATFIDFPPQRLVAQQQAALMARLAGMPRAFEGNLKQNSSAARLAALAGL